MVNPTFAALQEHPRIHFDAADFCRTLLRQRASVEYLSIYRRVNRNDEDHCGTLQLVEAESFLEEDALDVLTGELQEEEIPTELREVIGAWAWVQSTVLGNIDPDTTERAIFRLRAMGPKGHAKVFGRNLTVRPEVEEGPPQPFGVLRPPAASAAEPEPFFDLPPLHAPADPGGISPVAQHYQHLGNQYNHFGQLILGFFHGALQGHRAIEVQSGKAVQDARSQLADVLSVLVSQNTARDQREHNKQETEAERASDQKSREALKSLVEEVGSTARFVFASRNLSPQAQKLLETLGGDPELMGALADPKIIALLEDPEERKNLVILLRHAVGQASTAPPTDQPQPEAETRSAA